MAKRPYTHYTEEVGKNFATAFKMLATEIGAIPSVEDVVVYHNERFEPPVTKSNIHRRLADKVEDHPLLEKYGFAVAYAATIGVRNAVEVDGVVHVQSLNHLNKDNVPACDSSSYLG